jgi:hypothetical protein
MQMQLQHSHTAFFLFFFFFFFCHYTALFLLSDPGIYDVKLSLVRLGEQKFLRDDVELQLELVVVNSI